jgi:hypothetical protein
MAGIDHGTFYDLRRTCLSHWLNRGLSEFDVTNLTGHSKFETTRRFYLAVREDILDHARKVCEQIGESNLLRTCYAPAIGGKNERGPTSVSACQPSNYTNEAEGTRTLNLRIDSPML